MGYDLHITRKEFWCEEGQDITADEWIKFVESNSEFSFDHVNGQYFAIWKHNSQQEYWLDWFEGNIYTKNPDEILISKMIEIAKYFCAVVQGDDGELYDGNKKEEVVNATKKKSISWIEKIFGKNK
ncbi:MAG TPA: hypothetical protein VIO64_02785 [Pseudobacteroides sp.]|uniref:hypothetical protein n=1 Tax=Pseudobacteroides sp. TaxID=1968840 RepID=UPI002F94DEED